MKTTSIQPYKDYNLTYSKVRIPTGNCIYVRLDVGLSFV
jgi:hypothetical protein